MSWFLTNTIAALLLPPLNLLLLLALGLYLLHRHHKAGWPLIAASFTLLWLASTPFIAEAGLHLLEAHTTPPGKQKADAIVILGGGTYFSAPEYGGEDTVGEAALLRLRYGARLYRATGKPILVTGGKPLGNQFSEARQMKSVLEQDFGVAVSWVEDSSDNTYQNALLSHNILQKNGIKKIYLVTHAWHMPRAAGVFRRAGFDVVEAPLAYTTRYRTDLLAFLPNAGALRDSRIFMHELIGLLWYRVQSPVSQQPVS